MADTEGTAPTTAEEAVEQDQQQQQEKDEEVAQETAAENGEVEAESAPQEGEEKVEQEEKEEAEEKQEEEEAAEQGEETAATPEEQGETTQETQEEQNTVAAPESEQQNATGEHEEQEADVEEQKEQQEEEKEEEEEEKEEQEEEEPQREENGIQENGVSEDTSACEISEEDKEKCLMMFEKKAVNGRLDLKGFKVLFRLMGEVLSSADADSMFQDGARDDQGTIDFAEFCRLYMKFREAEQERKSAVATSIEKLFPTADDQPVELKKVESLLLKLQQPDLSLSLVREKSDLGQDDVRRLVKAMDKHGNGLISKTEFVDTLCDHLKM